MASRFLFWFTLVFFFLSNTDVAHLAYISSDVCEYTIFIRTGTLDAAGTDANVGVSLYNEKNSVFEIPDIINWGDMMGPKHNHFENGDIDLFRGSGQCLDGHVCAMKLVSDGSGKGPGWYVDVVEVTTCQNNNQCETEPFDVFQWLAKDELSYQLFAYRNKCHSGTAAVPWLPQG